jgi:hypothetical protein
LQTKAARAVCIGGGGVKSDWSAVIGVPYVDAKGILALEYEGGSREVWNMRFKWRHDKARDRFALVGETVQIRDTLSEDGGVERGSLSYEDFNYLSGKMIRKLGGKPEQKCAVKPGIAVLDLAAFDFEKFLRNRREVDGRLVRKMRRGLPSALTRIMCSLTMCTR